MLQLSYWQEVLKQLLDNPDQSRIVRRSLSLILACIALWFGWSTRI